MKCDIRLPQKKILCNNVFNNTHAIRIILQNKTRNYTHERLYDYAAEIVRHNALLAGNVFYYEVVPAMIETTGVCDRSCSGLC